MHKKMQKMMQVAGLLACMAATSDVYAGVPLGGVITYAPFTQAIPTLSDLMLVVLGLLTAVIAYRVLRAHPGSHPLASLAALALVGLSMVPGVKFIEQAYAIAFPEMTQAGGGTVNIPSGIELPVSNTSGIVQQIITVTPATGDVSLPTVGTPSCTPGLVVQPANSCFIYFDSANPT